MARRQGLGIRLRGTVQGVGFRPHVWRLARRLGLAGWVCNDGEGVLIAVAGEAAHIEQFLRRLEADKPPLARIELIETTALAGSDWPPHFEIRASGAGVATTLPAADVAICGDCLAEVRNPADRRYRYPFTSCLHCGPRFSILAALPYDRGHTSMAAFEMCPACLAEYRDPGNRRFHSQINACPQCGPSLQLINGAGVCLDGDPVEAVAAALTEGNIVAIKGLGGFHLACDGGNEAAVARLRARKRRPHKPFALLARDTAMVRRYARIDEGEQALLESAANPIVLLASRGEALAASVAPGQSRLGFALPATALHYLLMDRLERPLVLTSGNISGYPLCCDNEEALARLGGVAELFLLHNRPILNRIDDSVVRRDDGGTTTLRRARGLAPGALEMPLGFGSVPSILAMGAELKNSFALCQAGRVVVSHHVGDLPSAPLLRHYRAQIEHYLKLFGFKPERIAIDRHPDYQSSQLGQELAARHGCAVVEVQHHHAHLAAVMFEHGLPLDGEPVVGVVLDGLGLGEAGQLWGGEFFLADYQQCHRRGTFEAVALLGGERAMTEPWRNTLAQLLHWFDWPALVAEFGDLALLADLQTRPVELLAQMARDNLNSPPCSSAGRLFDAVAAALGLCRERISYEGQAALELEALAGHAAEAGSYPVEALRRDGLWRLGFRPLWQALLTDLERDTPLPTIAARFHNGLGCAVADLALRICEEAGVGRVVLAGGVFLNALLKSSVSRHLRLHDIQVLTPGVFPAGDGAISLGQVAVAAAEA